ncbi:MULTISPECIES: galactose ABC transporter substrate-binding protein [unclassified Clostridium]|uniref:galactose ABC transporter substrate-binding protein n=1 Tax=unclassified Clostridium TaxID=2614128 RepID=UPI000298051D|nr:MULTISPECIES: galactose ABC transporter substrate-binding protein [unclassified Clostridium]EKQ54374.1 MAG: ABC-type sugar transport system, periplasmic component [Clostridium sp. Maddingley MBC34-26]
MRLFRKILIVAEIIVIIIFVNSNKRICTQVITTKENPVKVAVLLYRFDDDYISLVRQSLEDIQKKNENKVQFTFYDGKNQQSIQNASIDKLLKNENVDFILLNLVDTKSTKEVINKIKDKNIPVVLFNREPVDIDAVKSYNKAYFVGTDSKEAGELQGKILVDIWNKDKEAIDENGDNIMQYIMLMGEQDNIEAIDRTRYSVDTINNAGIKTQELALKVGNWKEENAKDIVKSLFLQLGNKIEVIISNNDSMAIGAIEALQEYGYNNGSKTKTIPIVGVDALPKAQELIKKGFMTGSVLQDPYKMAEAIYIIGMNFVEGKSPLDGTQYKADDTGVAIRIPYQEYISK